MPNLCCELHHLQSAVSYTHLDVYKRQDQRRRKRSNFMLKVAVLVSGGGTNLQAILEARDNGTITNAKVEFVISNNKNAYALERAKNHGIEALCISPKDYGTRDAFNKAFLEKLRCV